MPGLALLFAVAALTVKQDGAELREGCEPGEPVVAKIAAGTAATIRFAMNGCYAVDVVQDGRVLTGFLAGDKLAGLDTWEAARRGAPSVEPSGNAANTAPRPSGGTPQNPVELLAQNRPGEALAAAERMLVTAPKDPQLLAFAGVAAYRNDMAARAAGYLKDSLAIRPDPAVQRLLEQVEREVNADRTGEPLHSTRFLFRYDPAAMPRETARALLGVLEQEFSRISFELGCQPAERLAVIVQTKDAYLRATGAAEWSGGQFDGRIRVALLEVDPAGPNMRRALAHELVHACVAATGNWPAWLHEGLAQKLSGETLSEPRRTAIRAAAQQDGVPKLANLSQTWSRMSAGHAAMAYATSLFAVELYYQHYAAYGIRNLLRNPDQLARVMTELDSRLRE
ncbi:MAG: hypothetical protein HYX27_02670 [Acidobacteria bacterium]|nr:hypothetical protein [Acidobacteriota bacterium]